MATITKALLTKYLDQQCTAEEAALVESYLQQPGSSAILSVLLEERLQKDIAASMQMPTDHAQQKKWTSAMHNRMGIKDTVMPVRKWYYVAAAASLLLIAGLTGIFSISSTKPPAMVISHQQNKPGQRKIIQLSDGSTIHLGAASSLEYPEQFTGNTREITLTGEAYFDITTDPRHPFIIHTGDVATTVLGTAFKIAAFAGQPITVAVASGKVKVESNANGNLQELAILTAGKQVSWHQQQATLQSVNAADVAAWQKGRLVFNNQTLATIAATLERWYDVKINFTRPQKANEKVTITLFAAGELKTTLQTLAAGNNFSYTTKGHEVTIH
ncbi:FecR family protein [Chitinophaga jiangningensis]|uniref:FecR family protein n=1 Tax=Chitinophaga jiangningensis TaxID=1419482 RepID=A0A1M7J4X7_9BACT|nr:FecR domain-containing protein [Chitinophaga jiangningensis]SHM47951.1 FecR family protein [Chitinophaga jiangningensis]